MQLLDVRDLFASYGRVQVLKGVSFSIEKGEVVTLVGPNGAGKSTILKALTGIVRPSSGTITFNGKNIMGRSPDQIVEEGIVIVPEGRRLFPRLTVLENLRMGASSKRARPTWKNTLEEVLALFPMLKDRAKQLSKTLSGGEAQALAIGRALMAKPELLLLDEPSLGLAPKIVEVVFQTVEKLAEKGTTMLIVEQHIGHALRLARSAHVVEDGIIKMSGKGEELVQNPYIKQHYLAA